MLRVKDVAKLLDVSESAVYGLCASGKLAHYRIGNGRGTLRFEREQVDAYLAAATVSAKEKTPAGKIDPSTGRVYRWLDPSKFGG